MLRQARSTSSTSNPDLVPLERPARMGNVAWVEAALADVGRRTLPASSACVLLLGGADALAFRLRVAQSHLRADMLPSYWSECVLLERNGERLADARIIHVPLNSPHDDLFPPDSNGLVWRPFTDFDDPAQWPNIALLGLPVTQDAVIERVDAFRKARSTLDALEHVLRWLAFAWGVAKTGNPLNDNYGLPSACMLETVCAGAQLDLTPGLEARASCPEAMWIAARFWQDYFRKFHKRAIAGRYWHAHAYPIWEPGDGPRTPPKARRSR
ncbi:MAG TPA: hypothetical protein VJM11_09160 [Nevskiaceae bacterium]|nr:hypothetical protein [Nevskiaceae bacterium]